MRKNVLMLLCLVAVATSQTKTPAAKPPDQHTATPVHPAPTSSLPTQEDVDAFMKQMVGYSADVSWRVAGIRPTGVSGLAEVLVVITDSQGSNTNKFYVTADGKNAVTGDIIPFGPKPFEADRVKLEKGVNGPSRGPAKAAVTIVEFSDLQCPHCKEVVPKIEALLAQEPGAHFIFQNFPLPGHDWAAKAAGYVDCVGRESNDAVWKFITKTFEQQENINAANVDEKLKAIATESGANADAVSACSEKSDTIARIEASLALGKSVGVNGTPTVFVNGRMVSGAMPVEAMKQIVDFQGAEAKAK